MVWLNQLERLLNPWTTKLKTFLKENMVSGSRGIKMTWTSKFYEGGGVYTNPIFRTSCHSIIMIFKKLDFGEKDFSYNMLEKTFTE